MTYPVTSSGTLSQSPGLVAWLVCLTLVMAPRAGLAAIQSTHAVVDDYAATETYRDWYYSRIGTDRGQMYSSASNQVSIGGGSASVQVISGWAGVWTSLLHRAADGADALDPQRLLGPYVLDAYQYRIVGVEVDVSDGAGSFKLELKGPNNTPLFEQTVPLAGGPQTLAFAVAPVSP